MHLLCRLDEFTNERGQFREKVPNPMNKGASPKASKAKMAKVQ